MPSGTEGYADLIAHADRLVIADGVAPSVAALEDVIRSKEAAGRPKAPAALPSLRRLLAEIRQGGNTRATLPLVRTHPAPHFRVSIAADARSSTLIALLVNVSDEVTWRQRVSDRNRDLSVLNDIGAELSSTIDMDELAGRIHEQTGRIMRADNFYIALHDRETERVTFPLYMEQGAAKPLAPREKSPVTGLKPKPIISVT